MILRHTSCVYRKELRETLRDRRTIMSMIIVPVLVMPMLIWGMSSLSLRLMRRAQEERVTVMLLGAENAPALAESLRANRALEIVPAEDDYAQRIEAKSLRAAVEFPPNFENRLAAGEAGPDLTVTIYFHEGEMRSGFAVSRLKDLLRAYHDRIVRQRLAERQIAPEVLAPFATAEHNVASPQKVSGAMLGGIIPYIIVLLAFTGAMYPAIDLTAGEKERGTIETILASPVSRSALTAGKFLTVLTASLLTTVLSLASMAVAMHVSPAMNRAAGGGEEFFKMAISLKGALAVICMLVPVAVMFSAVLLAIALLAKSYKEAQSYVSPLMIIVILPAVTAMLPGVELDARLALVPITNVVLVSKEILSGIYHWDFIITSFASSCAYALIALFVAATNFRRESVLFRT
jgi:sodium transport system permease protein